MVNNFFNMICTMHGKILRKQGSSKFYSLLSWMILVWGYVFDMSSIYHAHHHGVQSRLLSIESEDNQEVPQTSLKICQKGIGYEVCDTGNEMQVSCFYLHYTFKTTM